MITKIDLLTDLRSCEQLIVLTFLRPYKSIWLASLTAPFVNKSFFVWPKLCWGLFTKAESMKCVLHTREFAVGAHGKGSRYKLDPRTRPLFILLRWRTVNMYSLFLLCFVFASVNNAVKYYDCNDFTYSIIRQQNAMLWSKIVNNNRLGRALRYYCMHSALVLDTLCDVQAPACFRFCNYGLTLQL